jgi:hypothetical protein
VHKNNKNLWNTGIKINENQHIPQVAILASLGQPVLQQQDSGIL